MWQYTLIWGLILRWSCRDSTMQTITKPIIKGWFCSESIVLHAFMFLCRNHLRRQSRANNQQLFYLIIVLPMFEYVNCERLWACNQTLAFFVVEVKALWRTGVSGSFFVEKERRTEEKLLHCWSGHKPKGGCSLFAYQVWSEQFMLELNLVIQLNCRQCLTKWSQFSVDLLAFLELFNRGMPPESWWFKPSVESYAN